MITTIRSTRARLDEDGVELVYVSHNNKRWYAGDGTVAGVGYCEEQG